MKRRLLKLLSNRSFQLLGLVAVALVARLLFLEGAGLAGRLANNDAAEYNTIAASLLAGQGFAFGPGEPTAFRPFGYPWFLAAIYGVAGPSLLAVQWVQAALGSLIVLPTWDIARRLFGPAAAGLVGLGVALYPTLIYLTALVAPETVAILLQMLLLSFTVRLLGGGTRPWMDGLGLMLSGALAVWMRPESLLLLWLLMLGATVWPGLAARSTQALLAAAVLASVLAVAAPVARNWAVFHAIVPFPSVGGVTFWGGNNGAVTGGWVLPTSGNWPDGEPPASMRGWPGLTEVQSQARFYGAAWRWMRANPGAALALIPHKLGRSWTLTYADEGRSSVLPPAVDLLNWGFGLVVLLGMVVALRRHPPLVWVLFMPVVAWLAKTVVFYGSARQTAPVVPVLCIFAALAIVEVGRVLGRDR
jgi:hypothetical protein